MGTREIVSPFAFIAERDPLHGESQSDKVPGAGDVGGDKLPTEDELFSSLDNLYKNNSPPRCSRFPEWYFFNLRTGQFRRFRCKERSCRSCWRFYVSSIRIQVVDAILKWDLTRFATLTLDPKKLTADPYDELAIAWDRFLKSLKRFSPQAKYIWFKGVHASGVPHLHVLVNRRVDQRWLSETWSRVGGGKIVDIRAFGFSRIDVERVTNYVTSYLTKRDEIERLPKGRRFYGASRGVLEPFRKSREWTLVKLSGNPAIDRARISFLADCI